MAAGPDYTKLVAVYITTFIKTPELEKNIVRLKSDAGIQFDCMTRAIRDFPGLHPGVNDLIRVLGKQAHCASRTLIVCEPTCHKKAYSESKYHKNCGSPKKGRSWDTLCRPSSLWSPIRPESYYYDCFSYRQYPDRDAEYQEIEDKYNAIKLEKLDYSPPECDEGQIEAMARGKVLHKSNGAKAGSGKHDDGSKSSSANLFRNGEKDGVQNDLSSTGLKESSLGSMRHLVKPPGKKDGVQNDLSSTGLKESSSGSMRRLVKPSGSGSKRKMIPQEDSVPCSELAEIRDLLKMSDRQTIRRLQEMLTLMKELSVREICRATCNGPSDGRSNAGTPKQIRDEDNVPLSQESKNRFVQESGSKSRMQDDSGFGLRGSKKLYQHKGDPLKKSDAYEADRPKKRFQPKGGDNESYGTSKRYDQQGSRTSIQQGSDEYEPQERMSSSKANQKGKMKRGVHGQQKSIKKTIDDNDESLFSSDDHADSSEASFPEVREPRSLQKNVVGRKGRRAEESDDSYDRSFSSTTSDSEKSRSSKKANPPRSGRKGELKAAYDSDLTESSSGSLHSSHSTTDGSHKGNVNESDSQSTDIEPECDPSRKALSKSSLLKEDEPGSTGRVQSEDGFRTAINDRQLSLEPSWSLGSNSARALNQGGSGANHKLRVGKNNVALTVPEVVELSNKITDVIVKEVIDDLIKRGLYYPPSTRYSQEEEASSPKVTLVGTSIPKNVMPKGKQQKTDASNSSVGKVTKETIQDYKTKQTNVTSSVSRIDESSTSAGSGKIPSSKKEGPTKVIKQDDNRLSEESRRSNCPKHSRSISLSASSRRRSVSCRLENERRARSEGDRESTQRSGDFPPQPWERRLSSQIKAESIRDSSGVLTQGMSDASERLSQKRPTNASGNTSSQKIADNVTAQPYTVNDEGTRSLGPESFPRKRFAITSEYCDPDDVNASNYDTDSSFLYYTRITNNAFPPVKETFHSAGFMLRSAYNYEIPPKSKISVKTDLQLLLPRNSYGRIAPRKCLVENYRIDVVADVIDRDYKGNITVGLYNHGDQIFNPHMDIYLIEYFSALFDI